MSGVRGGRSGPVGVDVPRTGTSRSGFSRLQGELQLRGLQFLSTEKPPNDPVTELSDSCVDAEGYVGLSGDYLVVSAHLKHLGRWDR